MCADRPLQSTACNHLPSLDSFEITLPLEHDLSAKEAFAYLQEQLASTRDLLRFVAEERELESNSKDLPAFQREEAHVAREALLKSVASASGGINALSVTLFRDSVRVLKEPAGLSLAEECFVVLQDAYFTFGQDPLEREILQPLVAQRLSELMAGFGEMLVKAARSDLRNGNTRGSDYSDWVMHLPDSLLLKTAETLATFSKSAHGFQFDFACQDYSKSSQEARTLLALRTTGLTRDLLDTLSIFVFSAEERMSTELAPLVVATLDNSIVGERCDIRDYLADAQQDQYLHQGFIHNATRILVTAKSLLDSPQCVSNSALQITLGPVAEKIAEFATTAHKNFVPADSQIDNMPELLRALETLHG